MASLALPLSRDAWTQTESNPHPEGQRHSECPKPQQFQFHQCPDTTNCVLSESCLLGACNDQQLWCAAWAM